MTKPTPVFTRETFRFFKDLSRNNSKAWMDVNRERYQTSIVQPFRRLLEELSNDMLKLDSRFDVSAGRVRTFRASTATFASRETKHPTKRRCI